MTAVAADARVRLAPSVRLRQDRLTGRFLLLRPERGFELRGSALEIVRLCDGATTVAAIADRLAASHADVPRAQIDEDVGRLVDQLYGLRLIEIAGEGGP